MSQIQNGQATSLPQFSLSLRPICNKAQPRVTIAKLCAKSPTAAAVSIEQARGNICTHSITVNLTFRLPRGIPATSLHPSQVEAIHVKPMYSAVAGLRA